MNADPLRLLESTRRVNLAAAGLLSLQFYGNLYEQNAAIRNVVDPVPGQSMPALAAGSPLYFYMPWVIVGVVLAVVLLVQMRHHDFPAVRRDIWIALGSLAITVTAKVFLVTQVNDRFRDPTISPEQVVSAGWVWLLGNGVAVLASGASLWFLLRWRSRMPALIAERSAEPTTRHREPEGAS